MVSCNNLCPTTSMRLKSGNMRTYTPYHNQRQRQRDLYAALASSLKPPGLEDFGRPIVLATLSLTPTPSLEPGLCPSRLFLSPTSPAPRLRTLLGLVGTGSRPRCPSMMGGSLVKKSAISAWEVP